MFTNDGSIPYGSRVLTIGPAGSGGVGGVEYIADEITPDFSVKEIDRTNHRDAPSGSVNYLSFAKFSCTLQLADAATIPPPNGYETTIALRDTDNDGVLNDEIYFVLICNPGLVKDQENKVNVTFKRKYNA